MPIGVYDYLAQQVVRFVLLHTTQQSHIAVREGDEGAIQLPSFINIVILQHLLNEFGIIEEVVFELLQQIILGWLIEGNQTTKTEVINATLVVIHKCLHLLYALQSLFVEYTLNANLSIGIHSAILGYALLLQFGKVAIIILSKRMAGDIEPARLKIAYNKSTEIGIDIKEAVVSLYHIYHLAHIIAQRRLATRNRYRSQMSLLVHLIEQPANIGKKLLLVLSDVGILFDTERAGGVATVGNF